MTVSTSDITLAKSEGEMSQLTQDHLGRSDNDRHTNPRRLQFDHDFVPYSIGDGGPKALSVDDFEPDGVRRAGDKRREEIFEDIDHFL
jgi:hypothetical protein